MSWALRHIEDKVCSVCWWNCRAPRTFCYQQAGDVQVVCVDSQSMCANDQTTQTISAQRQKKNYIKHQFSFSLCVPPKPSGVEYSEEDTHTDLTALSPGRIFVQSRRDFRPLRVRWRRDIGSQSYPQNPNCRFHGELTDETAERRWFEMKICGDH